MADPRAVPPGTTPGPEPVTSPSGQPTSTTNNPHETQTPLASSSASSSTTGNVTYKHAPLSNPHGPTQPHDPDAITGTVTTDSLNSETDYEEQKDPTGTTQMDALMLSRSYATNTTATGDTTGAGENTGAGTEKKRLWSLNPLRWRKVPEIPTDRIPSREANANFLSLLTFQWMTPLMTTGYMRPLERNDIWTVNPDREVDLLSIKMKAALKARSVAKDPKYALALAIWDTFRFELVLGGILQLTSAILQVMSPFVLRYLIQFATDAWLANKTGAEAPHIAKGMGYVAGITAMQIVMSLATNHFLFRGMMVGGQSRAVLINLIFEKSLNLSGRARAGGAIEGAPGETPVKPVQPKKTKKPKKKKRSRSGPPQDDGTGWANGRVVNLMSVDTYRIDQSFALFHSLWTTPIQLLITLTLLLINLTYSALAGFGLLIIMVPLLARAIRSLFARRKMINRVTDQRVSLTQEILQSVRFVKFFGWENAFVERLNGIRGTEIRDIQTLMATRSAINAVSMSTPSFASMLAFITFTLTNHGMNPAKIFSSFALFNGLRNPLTMFPMVLACVIDAWSSVKRIQEYLLAEEMEEDIQIDKSSQNALEIHDSSFTWECTQTQTSEGPAADSGASKKTKKEKNAASAPDANTENPDASPMDSGHHEPFQLKDINLTFGRNELVAVIGGVGSGKTSLLAAMAGDMRKIKGEVMLGADRAFCPQYAWVQNATLQNNILFGKPMDKEWYEKVVHACALEPDLEMLPYGDQTEIGERGITISGGQKQRLNIARAIYFDADIVLMDDPLSAVDAHVGRHIFDNAIVGLLEDKCRILATHQLWVLNRCDRIIWMEEGRVEAIGTYDELMENNAGFRTLLETTAQSKKMEEEEDDSDSDSDSDEDVEATEALKKKAEKAKKKKKQKKKKKAAALMQQEERAISSVPWSVYFTYIRASGSILNAPFLLILLCIVQGANITMGLWLSWWTSDKFGYSTGKYIGVYVAFVMIQCILSFVFSALLAVLGTRASKHMLRMAMLRVLRAPMSFFDTTPLGRITNRFSRDVDVMDNTLTDAIRMYMLTVTMILALFGLIIAYFHWFVVALVPLTLLFCFSAGYYRSSAREVKRFESVLRSDVFARFSEGLSGIASIRAYGLKDRFLSELRTSIDEMDSAYFLTFSNQRWLALRLDFVGAMLVFTCGTLVVTSRFSVSPSTGGLVLSYLLSIVQIIQFIVRQLAEVENGMNAVERLDHYGANLDEEAPLHTVEVPDNWPSRGEIIFENVDMRYRKDLPLVLSGLSLHVQGGERIGIVGRTGAGKSSIMSTLFRLVEISSGKIIIDGLDIGTLGLHDLRSRMAIIPQDPTLFKGTVRSNLDPFHEHQDQELWEALRLADLVGPTVDHDSETDKEKDTTSSDSEKPVASTGAPSGRIHLNTVVEEEGLNFSLGQRQLMALARALVRNSQIIVCDEATSSVDVETDDKIQHTIATAFKGRTLLCIAHRLRTILNYDRICVMEQGRIAELGTPNELWDMEKGIFRGMCERGGIREEDIRVATA